MDKDQEEATHEQNDVIVPPLSRGRDGSSSRLRPEGRICEVESNHEPLYPAFSPHVPVTVTGASKDAEEQIREIRGKNRDKKDIDTRKGNSREIGEEKDIQDEKQRIEVKKKNNRYKFTQKKKEKKK